VRGIFVLPRNLTRNSARADAGLRPRMISKTVLPDSRGCPPMITRFRAVPQSAESRRRSDRAEPSSPRAGTHRTNESRFTRAAVQ